jgi:glutaredoxin
MKTRLFIKPYCGWCHKAMRWLDERSRPLQSQSDDRKLASDDSHWSASVKNFVLKGQRKTEFSRRPFRTQSSDAKFQPLRSWLISAVPSEQKSIFSLVGDDVRSLQFFFDLSLVTSTPTFISSDNNSACIPSPCGQW